MATEYDWPRGATTKQAMLDAVTARIGYATSEWPTGLARLRELEAAVEALPDGDVAAEVNERIWGAYSGPGAMVS